MNAQTNIAQAQQFNGSNVIRSEFKVDTSRGDHNGAVSSQWFSRPDDQRFTSLTELRASVASRRERSIISVVEPRDIRLLAHPERADELQVVLPNAEPAEPTNWSFNQLASLVKAPAGYLSRLPAFISAINLQHGLLNYRDGDVQTYLLRGERGDDSIELRAATGPQYGRIWDEEVVDAVMRIAGDGTGGPGGSHWKVPGVLNWRDGTYNPDAPITRKSTTLFASDRDVFLFLVDDRRPIEIGKLADGSPDLVFRGFYCANSEVGSKGFYLATFYLRGVCQNRILWGVEGYGQLKFRHSSGAPARFLSQARPALESYANTTGSALLAGVNAARAAIVAKDDDDARGFLSRLGFTKSETTKVLETVLAEEGRPARNVWDMVQGITATARTIGHQDERLAMEQRAGKLLDAVKAR